MQTKGEYRVGVLFNPSGDPVVTDLKRYAALLIDLIEKIYDGKPIRDNPFGYTEEYVGEIKRLKALAQTAIEDGAMWAVKAATKQERER